MAKHNDLGERGEALARNYLDQQGYLILDTNWRIGHYEVDIIATKDDRIVFIEVKTRTSVEYGEPEAFVDLKKRWSYIRIANAYIQQKNRVEEARFDIISVVISKEETVINHLVDAFDTVVL